MIFTKIGSASRRTIAVTMPDLFIPPPGFYFRLVGYQSTRALHSRTTQEPEVWHWYSSPEFKDQLFELLYGTDHHAGLYAIRGKVTGKVLFSRVKQEPRIGHTDGNGRYYDNYYSFEAGTGKLSSSFRMVCPSTSTVWVSRTTADPQVCNEPSDGDIHDYQYFSFVFEDTDIERVEYHVDQGKILNSTPIMIATQWLARGKDVTISASTQETSTFQFAQGFPIPLGAAIVAATPVVEDGKISLDTSSTSNFTWCSTTTTSKAYTVDIPMDTHLDSDSQAFMSVTQSHLDIPITVYSKSKETGVVVKTEGKYYGVTTWDLRCAISVAA
ncbi:hypothetical protein JR316_0010250 [Psilocybe cubensis]|uniref:Uncharacterized protein n=2 Tax=Psilocybe cubensis TaxID=181762 RepID=A0ACB8GQK5_PSICU|nr:hypothetical protein JR316_0010250 [Psilocybe cubensis]KAH9478015.1 hypothetical protein JR316_0010250 [Psilocybe cubensis]